MTAPTDLVREANELIINPGKYSWTEWAYAAVPVFERLAARLAEQDEEIDDILGERDRAQDALLSASMAMNGPEWCGKLPPEEPPNSGDLHYDVPVLAANLMTQLAEAQKDAARYRLLRLCSSGEWETFGQARYNGRLDTAIDDAARGRGDRDEKVIVGR